MGYAAAGAMTYAHMELDGRLLYSEEKPSCRNAFYDQNVKMWVCPDMPTWTPTLPEPQYRPVSTCPGCGAPMASGALICGYCRRPHGN